MWFGADFGNRDSGSQHFRRALELAESKAEERSARRFEGGAAFGGQSTAPRACAATGDPTMAGFDCISATTGAAADEDQESHTRSVAARRSDLAAGTESVDANGDGRLAGVGQATLRELAERAVAW